jgi:hypothetical protein
VTKRTDNSLAMCALICREGRYAPRGARRVMFALLSSQRATINRIPARCGVGSPQVPGELAVAAVAQRAIIIGAGKPLRRRQ